MSKECSAREIDKKYQTPFTILIDYIDCNTNCGLENRLNSSGSLSCSTGMTCSWVDHARTPNCGDADDSVLEFMSVFQTSHIIHVVF